MQRLYLISSGWVAFMAITLFVVLPRDSAANEHGAAIAERSSMKIRLIIDGRPVSATLLDNPTARDFFSLLPITLTLEDYAGTEKIAYLARKLTEQDAPAGLDPAVGDITYYAPWGNIALFYRDFGYAKGLIKLGNIHGDMDVFNVPGPISVTIEPD